MNLAGAGKGNAYFGNAAYIAQKASMKMDDLWSEISADTTSGSFPSTLELAGIFAESMEPTFL